VRGDGGGPKTANGKRTVSRNALKHGLTSDSPVIPGESHEKWQRHLDGVMHSLQPERFGADAGREGRPVAAQPEQTGRVFS
jgi:hypothetical protein